MIIKALIGCIQMRPFGLRLSYLLGREVRRPEFKEGHLKVYQAIKEKQIRKNKKRLNKPKRISSPEQKQELNPNQNKQDKHRINVQDNKYSIRCNGCNSALQSDDPSRYGYIPADTLSQAISANRTLIADSYTPGSSSQSSNMYRIIHEVERQMGVKILNHKGQMDGLEDVGVMVKLQEKIDEYEQQAQTIRRSKKMRKQLYCYRCYSLKYHNRLPPEFDLTNSESDLSPASTESILNRLFNKHANQPVHFLYLLDPLDICGSFQYSIFQRLVKQKCSFSIVINKIDIVNEKYVNVQGLVEGVRTALKLMCRSCGVPDDYRMQIKIFTVSSVSKSGVKKIQEYLENIKLKKVQLLGVPNCGKTTLLNSLAKLNKPVSRIPGTTPHITENRYKKHLLYDMPGLSFASNLTSLIVRPNLRSLLTWSKIYSPPMLTHSAYFYGGKIEAYGVRLILFGLEEPVQVTINGSCSIIASFGKDYLNLMSFKQQNMKQIWYSEMAKLWTLKLQDMDLFPQGFVKKMLQKEGKQFSYIFLSVFNSI